MKIELIPAIDIIGGRCVRLMQGDYERQKVYDEDPVAVALRLETLGFSRLHVVDLDGAKSKHVVNDSILKEITRATRLKVDFGGGVKTSEDIDKVFEAGAQMVTVGSVAVTNPNLLRQWGERYGSDRLILGADVRNGKVAINGWIEDSGQELIPFLRPFVRWGFINILCTDIGKDGTLQGPAVKLYKEIMNEFPHIHLIASGGISGNADIELLESEGIPAVVFGKAFYEGKINVKGLGL